MTTANAFEAAPVTQADLDAINAGLRREGIEPIDVASPAVAAAIPGMTVTRPSGTVAPGCSQETLRMSDPCASYATGEERTGRPLVKQEAEESLKFLDDFFGTEKRHLVAIRKREDGSSEIKGRHFPALDRAGQQRFIADHEAAGYDIYFTPNALKAELHKKASKDDVAGSRWLWVDMDPRDGKPLEGERADMLALGTTNLPAGIPKPNRVIDSGRGYWLFWTLDTPQPTDGKDGQLTTTVESYGRGLEQAFSPFADNCHNIDRIGRLPGTRNSKTGNVARVLHEYSHDTPYPIGNFPRASDQKPKPDKTRATDIVVSDEYEPVTRDAPELAKLDAAWITRIFDGDTDGRYKGDRSRLAFAVACELVRVGLDDQFSSRPHDKRMWRSRPRTPALPATSNHPSRPQLCDRPRPRSDEQPARGFAHW